jgi:hypothetical protein
MKLAFLPSVSSRLASYFSASIFVVSGVEVFAIAGVIVVDNIADGISHSKPRIPCLSA